MKNIQIFIGYDSRESIAAEVCKHSIEYRTPDVECTFLKTEDIPEYSRVIKEPQSTDFTFSRFWVPYLSDYEGYSIFCDCDFIFLKDMTKLLNVGISNGAAVSVVKHPLYTPRSNYKMDHIPQHSSIRKNWASLMVFDNSKCKMLTPDYLINVMPGRSLHQFNWLPDSDIGDLPMEWNVLDGYYDVAEPCGIHYTDGGPWFDGYKQTRYSQQWEEEFKLWSTSFA